MALARTYSVALIGITGHVVEVEADIANGLPAMILSLKRWKADSRRIA